ncbi:hypothetical protein LAZ67_1005910, partial [Cordylochernes scorpioides]
MVDQCINTRPAPVTIQTILATVDQCINTRPAPVIIQTIPAMIDQCINTRPAPVTIQTIPAMVDQCINTRPAPVTIQTIPAMVDQCINTRPATVTIQTIPAMVDQCINTRPAPVTIQTIPAMVDQCIKPIPGHVKIQTNPAMVDQCINTRPAPVTIQTIPAMVDQCINTRPAPVTIQTIPAMVDQCIKPIPGHVKIQTNPAMVDQCINTRPAPVTNQTIPAMVDQCINTRPAPVTIQTIPAMVDQCINTRPAPVTIQTIPAMVAQCINTRPAPVTIQTIPAMVDQCINTRPAPVTIQTIPAMVDQCMNTRPAPVTIQTIPAMVDQCIKPIPGHVKIQTNPAMVDQCINTRPAPVTIQTILAMVDQCINTRPAPVSIQTILATVDQCINTRPAPVTIQTIPAMVDQCINTRPAPVTIQTIPAMVDQCINTRPAPVTIQTIPAMVDQSRMQILPRQSTSLAAIPTSNAAAQVRRNWADITEEVNPGAEEGFTLVQGRKRRRGSANSPTAAAPSSNPGGSRTIRRPQPSAHSVPRAQEIPTTRAHIAEARARQASSAEEHCIYLEHGPELQPFHYLRALDRLLGGTAGVVQVSKVNGHQLLGLANRGLAERLINNGLEVEGTLLRAFPFRKRAERITVGNLPFFVEDAAIIKALGPYGRITSIAPKMMKAGPYTYTDARREAFIVLHEGVTTERLPTRLNITIKGEAWPAYLSSGIKCSRCHGQGHRRANCPLLAGRTTAPGPATPTAPTSVPPATAPRLPQQPSAQPPPPASPSPTMEVSDVPPTTRAAFHPPAALRQSPPAPSALPAEDAPPAPPPVTPAPSLRTPGSREPAAPTPDVEMSIAEETSAFSTSSAKNATRVDLDAFIEKHPSVSFAGTDALGLGREEVLDLLSSRTKAQRKGPLLSPPQCDALAGLIRQILDLRPGAASNLYKVLGQVKAELRTTPAAVPTTPPLPAPRPAEPMLPTTHREELTPPSMTPPPPAPTDMEEDNPMTEEALPAPRPAKPAPPAPHKEDSFTAMITPPPPLPAPMKQKDLMPDIDTIFNEMIVEPGSRPMLESGIDLDDVMFAGRKRRRGSGNSPTTAAPSSNAGASRTIRRPQSSAGSVPRAQEIRATRAHIAEARARQASSSEEHCVYIEHSPELEPFHYLRALDRMLGGTAGVIQITKVNGHQLLGLTNRGLAERLISEGLEVEGTLLRAFPFRKRAERITVGNLPFFVADSAVITALSPYGRVTSIAPKQMKAGPYVYVDGRRDVFITLHEGITIERLPTRLDINIKGQAWPAYLSSGIRCSRCHGQGHRRAICPLLAGLANNTRTAPPTTPAGVPPPTTPAPPQRSAAQPPAPTPSNPAMEVCSAPPVARAALHSSAPRPSPPAAPAFPMEETPPAPPPVTPAPSLQTPGSREPAAPTPDVEMSIVEETFASSTSSAKNATRVDLDAFIEGLPSVSFAKTDALGLGREEVLDLLSSRTKAQRKGPLLSPPQCDALVGLIGQILDLKPGHTSNLYKVLGQVKAELRTTPAEPPTPPLSAPRPSGPTPPTPHSEELMPAVMTPPPPALEDNPDLAQWE